MNKIIWNSKQRYPKGTSKELARESLIETCRPLDAPENVWFSAFKHGKIKAAVKIGKKRVLIPLFVESVVHDKGTYYEWEESFWF